MSWSEHYDTWCLGAMFMRSKSGKHSKSKHIENKSHYVWHLVEDGTLKTRYYPAYDMTFDVMTKALGIVKFEKFRTALCIVHVNDYVARNKRKRPKTLKCSKSAH